MSKIISSFASISPSAKSKPIRLDFSEGWGYGPMFNWHNSLAVPQAKYIKTIQIWKEVSGPVPHRFIVVRTQDNHDHRFDRRPDRSPDAPADTIGLLFNQAVACEDSCVLNVDIGDIKQISECEIELNLDGEVDILVVVSTCYAMHTDEDTRQYSFLCYNCFFFSWTIMMVISRHNRPYEVPSYESVIGRFLSEASEQIIKFTADEGASLILELVVDTVTSIERRERSSISPASGSRGQGGWGMPIRILQFRCRQALTTRLRFSLQTQLMKVVREQVIHMASEMQRATLSHHIQKDVLNKHLWIDDIRPMVKEVLEKELKKCFWEAIIEIAAGGLGSTGPQEIERQLREPGFMFSLLGKDIRRLCAVCSAALHGALQASRDVKQDLGNLDHNDAFDRAWNAARRGGLEGAREIFEKSLHILKTPPSKVEQYNAVWRIWDECWADAQERTRTRTVSKIKWFRARPKPSDEMTTAKLQEYMSEIIKKDTVNVSALEAVHASMGHVWKAVCKLHPSIQSMALEVVAEKD
ncbi:hypothetical protein FRC11_013889 [Ceratobasidium sp. 423]|nr:hypothetical protein FRC11_013889 [Ceratobasidium sp. 423]